MHLDSNVQPGVAEPDEFIDDEGTFDVKAFRKAVEVVFTAQEIIVGPADYPTEKIGANARAFRQLGLEYANLGALLMAAGSRTTPTAGGRGPAITALMTEAERTGPTPGSPRRWGRSRYEPNADAMLRVMRKHRAAADEIDGEAVPRRCSPPRSSPGRRRSRSGPSTVSGTRRRRCWRQPGRSG